MARKHTSSKSKLYVGIDIGTSACRALAIDAEGVVMGQAESRLAPPRRHDNHVEQDAEVWWRAVLATLHDLFVQVPAQTVQAMAVDGTSGTVLIANAEGDPLGPALMYNDARSLIEAGRINELAPRSSAAHGTGGGLAKLLYLQGRGDRRARFALNQADWISGRLSGRYGVSDENNCLKLGFDPIQRCWPDWLEQLGVRRDLLPEVVPAGTPIASVSAATAHELGLKTNTLIVAGTTDSTAAVIATGINTPGEAVTSLGSTLVMKVASERPVFAPEYGVYSQRLDNLWLAGGGSNSGGAVLQHYFSPEKIAAMTPLLRPDQITGLDYYPLLSPGERFPVFDPKLKPRVSPRPADDVQFFQGLVEGMARIEQRGYQLLASLGAPYPTVVCSAGGGAVNEPWMRIRERLLNIPVTKVSAARDAAYGAALLALRG